GGRWGGGRGRGGGGGRAGGCGGGRARRPGTGRRARRGPPGRALAWLGEACGLGIASGGATSARPSSPPRRRCPLSARAQVRTVVVARVAARVVDDALGPRHSVSVKAKLVVISGPGIAGRASRGMRARTHRCR